MSLEFSEQHKKGKRKKISFIIFSCLLALGTVSLFFSNETGIIIYVFSFMTLIVSIIINYQTEQNFEEKEEFNDYISLLFAKEGKGTPYLEKIKANLDQKHYISKKHYIDVEKAYKLDKNNIEALRFFIIQKTAVYLRYKMLKKKIKNENLYLINLEKIIREGILKYPNEFEFYETLGIILDYKGEFPEARQCYFKAGELTEMPYWRIPLSISYGMTHEYYDTLKHLRDLIKKEGKIEWTYFNLGRVHYNLGNYNAAIKYLKISRKSKPKNYECLEILAKSLFSNLNFGKASQIIFILIFHSILNSSFKKTVYYFFSLFLDLFLPFYLFLSNIIFLISKHMPIINKYKNPFFRRDILEHSRALRYIKDKLYSSGIRNLKKAIIKMPFRVDNYNYLAMCYYGLGKKKEALNILEKALLIEKKPYLVNNYNTIKEKIKS